MKIIMLLTWMVLMPFMVLAEDGMVSSVWGMLPGWIQAVLAPAALLAFVKLLRKLKKFLKELGVNVPAMKTIADMLHEGAKFLDGILNPSDDPEDQKK